MLTWLVHSCNRYLLSKFYNVIVLTMYCHNSIQWNIIISTVILLIWHTKINVKTSKYNDMYAKGSYTIQQSKCTRILSWGNNIARVYLVHKSSVLFISLQGKPLKHLTQRVLQKWSLQPVKLNRWWYTTASLIRTPNSAILTCAIMKSCQWATKIAQEVSTLNTLKKTFL